MVTGKKPWGFGSDWGIVRLFGFIAKMYQIGLSGKFPALPESSQMDEPGLDFLKCRIDLILGCFKRPGSERIKAAELKKHCWLASLL